MADPTTELRERHEQEKNETPEIDEGDDGDGGDGNDSFAGKIPTPSVDKKLVIGVAVVVAAIVAWKLYKGQQSGGGPGGSLDDATGDGLNAEATIEDEELEQEDIRVPAEANATEKDQAVTEAFRNRGVISSSED